MGGVTLLKSLALQAVALLAGAVLSAAAAQQPRPPYPWLGQAQPERSIEALITPPPGFTRIPAAPGSFARWLRDLPLQPLGAPVRLYTGADKRRQDAHVAVVDIDVGSRDLQQCADAVMRLRAEWLRATGRDSEIAFNYTGGGRVPWTRWARGERPSSDGQRWSRTARSDESYVSFRRYLDQVFTYAGTYSLERELRPVALADARTGDIFIKGGFPGHAVLVADMVENAQTGERRFLLLQSFMPAQDIHVLRNPRDPAGGPWYALDFTGDLLTPEWTFPPGSLRRWP